MYMNIYTFMHVYSWVYTDFNIIQGVYHRDVYKTVQQALGTGLYEWTCLDWKNTDHQQMCSLWFHLRWNHVCMCAGLGQSRKQSRRYHKCQVLGIPFSFCCPSPFLLHSCVIIQKKQWKTIQKKARHRLENCQGECGSVAIAEETNTSIPFCKMEVKKNNRWFKSWEINSFFF